ncbi:MAG: RHS repeat domain-containing protein, partial [Nitrospiraceae bacterium]
IYTYDPASQVTNILHKIVATSAQINKADYVYNNVGNRTSLTDRRGAQAFGYDTLDRLTSASHPLLGTPQSFAYDPVGNRTTSGSVHNVANQLTADASFSYQYDDNGNLTRKTLLASGNHTDYTYDAENRLTKVEEFTVGNPVPVATSTYRYDGLGRRIEKVGNGITRRYVYDGEDILLEYDGANVLQARYTHGPGIDEPIAMTRGGSTFFYHQDGLGSVTELTDSTGSTGKTYSYDAYGNILDQTGTVENPYTYTGREFDAESGLYYYRARYYDPVIGRFILEDPAGFVDGPNIYSYVRNNPQMNIDPLGLQLCNGRWRWLGSRRTAWLFFPTCECAYRCEPCEGQSFFSADPFAPDHPRTPGSWIFDGGHLGGAGGPPRGGMTVPPAISSGGPPGKRGFPGGGMGRPPQRGAGDVLGQGNFCLCGDPGPQTGCGCDRR